MTDPSIQHVSDTAFWVAVMRARESQRPDALFRDPLAARLVEGRGEALAARMPGIPMMQWNLAVRTALIDDLIRSAIADGVDAVLNLGAGLDTRPYRMPLPASLRWVEADFPDLLAFKEARLGGEQPGCALKRVGADLSQPEERRALLDGVAAGASKILVLTEGVVPYLDLENAGALADDLHARPAFALWIVDRFSRAFLRFRERSPVFRQLENVPFRFDPDDWEGFFTQHGWRVRTLRYLAEEARRFGRRPPLPLWMRLARRLAPGERRRAADTMTGYALLERAGQK